ncbi:hypothetical protein [Phage f2b1]|nr:hypothetical protein [Phage f2b1]
MESMELTWKAYGDVNPIEHGGEWVLPNKDADTDFFIVRIINLDSACGEPGFLVEDIHIDINDYNEEDIEDVKSFIGADDTTENAVIALGFLQYYGPEHLGGTSVKRDTEEEARAEVESHGVDIEL